MSIITSVTGRSILDSRGNPTLEVLVEAGGNTGAFAVPSGASTGVWEAKELRDGGEEWGGLGVEKALTHVREVVAPALVGLMAEDQQSVDEKLLLLDGTPDKSNLGGNTLIGASIAVAKAAGGERLVEHLRSLVHIAPSREEPLLYMNLINGGKHARTGLSFQEFIVIPQVSSAKEALEIGSRLQHHLGNMLVERYGPTAAEYGDEGGFAPDLKDNAVPLALLSEAIEELSLQTKVRLGLDVAASSFWSGGEYKVGEVMYTREEMHALYATLVRDYNLFSVEDPFEEEAFGDFAQLHKTYPDMKVVGDDLTVTNVTRLTRAIEEKSVNALIIKPNQIGTLWETLQTMQLARTHNIDCVVSHRSGETNDTFIADLALAFGAFGLKAGAPQRGERVAKYNRLVQLTEK